MKLFLILALALLGAVSKLDASVLERDIRNEQAKVASGEPELPCPTESETFQMIARGTGGHTCRYVVVNNCQTFWHAQNLCARCYRGQLASIHNHAINEQLRCAARAYTHQAQVWIGGYTNRGLNCVTAHWMDKSAWNYANWAHGNQYGFGINCVAICTAGGHWRCLNCAAALPFICEY